jgi:hypothetical protein
MMDCACRNIDEFFKSLKDFVSTMASKADIRKKILELYSIEELKQTGPKKLTARVGEALGAELDKQAVQEIAIEIICE